MLFFENQLCNQAKTDVPFQVAVSILKPNLLSFVPKNTKILQLKSMSVSSEIRKIEGRLYTSGVIQIAGRRVSNSHKIFGSQSNF